MNRLALLCTPMCLLLTACAVPDFGAPKSPPEPAIQVPAGGPYSQGPVRLLVDGEDGATCRFNLQALYHADIEPHSIELHVLYTDLPSGNTADIFGGIQQLPLVDVPWTRMTADGVMTTVTNWEADGPCAQSRLSVTVIKCWQGNCPRYVAGEHAVPMEFTITP